MIVQERGDGKQKTSIIPAKELRNLKLDSEDEYEKDIEQVDLHQRTKISSWEDFHGYSSYGDNLPKFIVILFVVSSILVLSFYRTHGETAAVLCIEEVAKELEGIPYPMVSLEHIQPAKDYTRYAAVSTENWVVVIVSDSPTPEVEAFAKLKGWQVLTVGTDDTPKDWRVANVIFLAMDQQSKLGYRIG